MSFYYIIASVLLLFVLLNHVIDYQPKRTENQAYAATEDMWFKNNNNKLVILLHGMYSTPSTFEEIAPQFLQAGWDVYVPALPASAPSLEELQKIGPWTWNESIMIARAKIKAAKEGYDTLVLGGHSQGGSLSMALAPSFDLKALIVIASPITLYGNHMPLWKNIGIYFSGIFQYLVPQGLITPAENVEQRKNLEKRCDAEGINYPLTLYTFKKGLTTLRSNLHKIKVPLFLSYDQGDKLVHFKNKEYIASHVSSPRIEEVLFHTTKEIDPYGLKHQLLNYEFTKDKLNAFLLEFLKSIED